MSEVRFESVPQALRCLPQWILWRNVMRDGKAAKMPFQIDGSAAKSNDPTTWNTFDAVRASFRPERYAGPGFVFASDGGLVGVDLDGCRNSETGKVEDWAREAILKFASYAEVSPSLTGVKIFCVGRSPFDGGRKVELPDIPAVCDKMPAVEVYDRGRYFAVTGQRLAGPAELRESQSALDWLKAKFWPDEPTPIIVTGDFHGRDATVARARKYLEKIPPAVSGQGGHNATFHAACVLVLGFELAECDAVDLLREWNTRCQPPWQDKDIVRKVSEASKQPGRRGYLKNATPANWSKIEVPEYKSSQPTGPRTTTLVEATRAYVESIRDGMGGLVRLGIPDLDYAIGGGVAHGEMVIFAARPSHGKSAVALQCIHHWTANGMPCAVVSEEMSSMVIGRRTLQFLSERPEERWRDQVKGLLSDIDDYAKDRQTCVVIESCGTAETACVAVERAVHEHGIMAAVIDYAQLLRSPGNGRYEQVTNTSIMLRQLASRTKIVLLVLCQLSRGVEQRQGLFSPVMSDLKDTGQLEQDADVITFLCWPHRLDQSEPIGKYQFFTVKNRNRPINESVVNCHFIPSRQTVTDTLPSGEPVRNPFIIATRN